MVVMTTQCFAEDNASKSTDLAPLSMAEQLAGADAASSVSSPLTENTPHGTCASCSMSLPKHLRSNFAPVMTTRSDNGYVCVSSRHPKSHERFVALRQSCVRALNCEITPKREGPLFFSDSDFGYATAYLFSLRDKSARGGTRSYALLSLKMDPLEALSTWENTVRRFENIASRLISANLRDYRGGPDADHQHHSITSPTSAHFKARSPEGFLRKRDDVGGAKSLAELTSIPDIYIHLHVGFSWLLALWQDSR